MSKEITVTIGSNEYPLRYDFNAICQIEELLEINVFQASAWEDFGEKLSARKILILLWAGIIHKHPEMTREDLGKEIDLGDAHHLVEKVTQALTEALPKNE